MLLPSKIEMGLNWFESKFLGVFLAWLVFGLTAVMRANWSTGLKNVVGVYLKSSSVLTRTKALKS
jgi:hypothetical protein